METFEVSQFVNQQFAQFKETILNITNINFSVERLFNNINLVIRKEEASKIMTSQLHKSVKMWFEANECYVDIDEAIAPLIKEIWDADITTLMCCENNVPKDYIWIQFERQCDYDNFMTIVLDDCNDTNLIDRLDTMYIQDNSWIVKIDHCDIGKGYYPTKDVKYKYGSNISLRFPNSDYEFVLEQFKKRNKDNNKK